MGIKWTKDDVIKKFQEAIAGSQTSGRPSELLTKFREIAEKRKAGVTPPVTSQEI